MMEAQLNNECADLRARIQQITDGEYATAKRDVDALRAELGQPPVPGLQATLEEKSQQYLHERRLGADQNNKRPADETLVEGAGSGSGSQGTSTKRPRGRPKGSKNRAGKAPGGDGQAAEAVLA
jgi:hypothetical protein